MVTAEPTDDGRYVVINGRRWRATDPMITEPDAADLRKHLMAARRGVKSALHAEDATAERAARDRVQLAKVGLGERGTPWWEQTDGERAERVRDALRHLAEGETDTAQG